MHGTNLLFLAFFTAADAFYDLRGYEYECRTELAEGQASLDPCQRACELEKIGLLRDGRFELERALALVDARDGLTLYPDNRKLLLKAAICSCNAEIRPMKSVEKCTAAAAMYYCVESVLQPERMYRKRSDSPNHLSYASGTREELHGQSERTRSQPEKMRSQRGSFQNDVRDA